MGIFKRNKEKDILDLTERYKKQQERLANIKEDMETSPEQESSSGAFGFLGNLASSSDSNSESQASDYVNVSDNSNEKRKRLAKRLTDITEKLEDLGNQIYHMQQRIEVLERKSGINVG